MNKGITTIAQGTSRFINMAVNLAKSLDLNSPGFQKAVITDQPMNELLNKHFDFVISIENDIPPGFTQKLMMYTYSPFEETLWIDSDCLVINSLDTLIEQFRKASTDVSCIGFTRQEGQWAGVDINEAIRKLGIPYLIIHNGGVYYFRKGDYADKVFEKAKQLLSGYDTIGFYKLRGKTAHEPLMSSAMSFYHAEPIDDCNRGMRTFVDISSELKIDVLHRQCTFYEFKGANRRLVKPVIAHFSGSHADWFHYKRETAKMSLHTAFSKIPNKLTSQLVNYVYNPPYIFFIFVYRTIKAVLGREKFKLKPLMPALRYK